MAISHAKNDAFHAAMSEASVYALWERETRRNEPAQAAHVWRWDTLDPLLDQAAKAATTEEAERRVLCLDNPAFQGTPRDGAAINLSVNLQLLLPGETARPHRHSMNALRFVLESDGAVTIVDGKECVMARGDMILTPGWTWHEHAHHGKKRAVWVDALDVPIHGFLESGAFEPGPAHDVPHLPSDSAYASAGLTPVGGGGTPYSPLFRYAWDAAITALAATPEGADGARRLRYINPVTGGPAMTALDCYLVALAKGRATTEYRSSANAVCVVAEGAGTTKVGGDTLDWKRNDIFCVPHNNWVSHTATADDTVIFEITDRDILARLGLLRDEVRA